MLSRSIFRYRRRSPVENTVISHTQSRHGELSLRFACYDHQTRLVDSFFKTPLQVMQPILDETGCLLIYLLSPTGGVVQGDRYCIDIVAEENTHAIFTTQAATKVYRMPQADASQIVNIEVYPGAVFEYIPDATILFKGSNFRQEVNITLHPGAMLLMQDIIMPGRLARGEVMEFDSYKSILRIRDDRGLILYEPVALRPVTDNFYQMGILEGYTCWGSWYCIGEGIAWNEFCRDALPVFEETSDSIGSISTLYRNGVGARVISNYVSPIYACFEHLRQRIRTQYLNLPHITLRK